MHRVIPRQPTQQSYLQGQNSGPGPTIKLNTKDLCVSHKSSMNQEKYFFKRKNMSDSGPYSPGLTSGIRGDVACMCSPTRAEAVLRTRSRNTGKTPAVACHQGTHTHLAEGPRGTVSPPRD